MHEIFTCDVHSGMVNQKDGFGVRVSKLRKRRKLSQGGLGLLADISQPRMSRIEASEDVPTEACVISRIAQALDVPITELTAGLPVRRVSQLGLTGTSTRSALTHSAT